MSFGFWMRWKTGRCKTGELAVEFCVVMAHLCVEGAPVRIDHPCRVRNRLAAMLDQTVNIVVFAHVFEEVFLTPACERAGRSSLSATLR